MASATRRPLTSPTSPPCGPLDVPSLSQEQTNWCWAACVSMVADYYSPPPPSSRQCNLAHLLFMQDCCSSPVACNRGIDASKVVRAFSLVGLRATFVGAPVSLAILDAEIGAGRPAMVRYTWDGGGAHAAIVRGSCETFVWVNDPWFGPGYVAYDSLSDAQGMGRWTRTWTGITR